MQSEIPTVPTKEDLQEFIKCFSEDDIEIRIAAISNQTEDVEAFDSDGKTLFKYEVPVVAEAKITEAADEGGGKPQRSQWGERITLYCRLFCTCAWLCKRTKAKTPLNKSGPQARVVAYIHRIQGEFCDKLFYPEHAPGGPVQLRREQVRGPYIWTSPGCC